MLIKSSACKACVTQEGRSRKDQFSYSDVTPYEQYELLGF
uniref:Uncharacterized protein n=1 Tax=Anguilla anguilla TaxID=7936 RepID=A0A0E9RL43_ANGAN